MLEDLTQWMLNWSASPYAVWALFFIAFAESSLFPVPPDVLLIALVLSNPDHGLWLAMVTTLGSVLGGTAGYLIGIVGGRPLLTRFATEDRVVKVQRLYDAYGAWAIGIAGFTPIPYKVVTIASGVFAFPIRPFVLASLLGRGGRFFLVAVFAQVFGERMLDLIDRYFNLATVVMVLGVALGVYLFRTFRRCGTS